MSAAPAAAATPVRCVVVGLGEMGRLHAACLAASPLAELVAVCDPAPGARAAAEQAGVPLFASLEAALAAAGPLEAAVVCTPPDRHLAPVRAALDAGLHVLCEKPLASTHDDVTALLELDAAHPERLVVGHLRRFDPRFLALRDAVADGRIGAPSELSGSIACPRADAERLAGTVSLALELAVHDLDAMRWLTGRRVVRVHAEALDVQATPGPDAIVATVRFEGGAIGVLHHAWTLPDDAGIDWEFRFRLSGPGGVGEIDGRDRGLRLHMGGAARSGPIHPDTFSWPAAAGGGIGGALREEVLHFLQRVRDGRPWPLSVAQAHDAVLTALAIDRSIERGAPVDLPAGAAERRRPGTDSPAPDHLPAAPAT